MKLVKVTKIDQVTEDGSTDLSIYPSAITYDGDSVDYITYNLGNGLEVVKTFNYTDGKITSIVLTGDVPTGINTTKTFSYVDEKLTSVEQ